MKFTYGSELEFTDADRRLITLPEGCKYSEKEVTLVNSDGSAVNSTPTSKNWRGGEINTPPTYTIKEQLALLKTCLKSLKKHDAGINYRCNFQTHIGLPPEHHNLESLKAILSYTRDNWEDMLWATCGKGMFVKNPDMPHHTWLHYKEKFAPDWRYQFLINAKDMIDLQVSFCKDRSGKIIPMTFNRYVMNVHSFFKTQSIEMRGYWATLDINEMEHCLKFHHLYIEQALTDRVPVKEYIGHFKFPKELPYDPELEAGYQKTRVGKPGYGDPKA